jgi:hypothetical protein
VVASVTDWYGSRAAWWAPLERDARRRFGPTMRHRFDPPPLWPKTNSRSLTYCVSELDVVGDPEPITVTITFYDTPPYPLYSQQPHDYPRVYARPGATSKHRNPDDSLCMWFPHDPAHRRWASGKGLLELVELTRQHLFLENYWREHGVWLLEDAPHGFPRRR